MGGRRLFFSGIGGSGVSAIACFMAERGHRVAGSDRAFDKDPEHALKKILHSKGVSLFPQDGTGIDGSLDLVVFSTAVEPDTPEYVKAESLGLSTKSRPEYLAEIVGEFNTVAVSGTSGKSTTSGMLAFLMKRLGMGPNFIGGGRVKNLKTPLNPGNYLSGDSDTLVIEACESDGSIVNYRPRHTIILNLTLDHHPVEKTKVMFEGLVRNTLGAVVINADDGNLKDIGPDNAVTFSLLKESQFMARDIVYKPFGTEFTLNGCRFDLSLPGRYNLSNALAAIAMLSTMGIGLEDISVVLHEFSGIERRFDVHLNDGKSLVIDDYAHNPHKIASLIEAVSAIKDKVCYIFQPHGYGPTRLMKDGYIAAFARGIRKSDHLMLLPIYYPGGTVIKDISSEDLALGVRGLGGSADALSGRAEVFQKIGGWDAYVVIGARDETLSSLAENIAARLNGK